jgi:pimeloyl-ACP methyl ester carboxylesterase
VPRAFSQPASPSSLPGAAEPRHGSEWGRHATWHWRGHACHWRRLGGLHQPPLVLLHGFGAGSGHWRRNAAVLADAGWCVYGLDLLGFGASSQVPLRLDNRLWARQLEAFLREVVQRPAVLVGHSLGGLVALTCGVFFPQAVRAVVAAPLPDPTLLLADPQAPAGAPPRRPWRRRLQRFVVTWLCRLLPLELLVPLLAHSPLLDLGIQAAYRDPVIGDDELHRLIARPARRAGAVRALRAMSIAMALRPHGATAPALLRRLRHPCLLLWGGDDRLVPLDVGLQCRRLRPDLALEVIDQAGHCPHDEKPDAFHRVLIPWLASL